MRLRSKKKSVKINIKVNKYYDIYVSNKQKKLYKIYHDLIKENIKNKREIRKELLSI